MELTPDLLLTVAPCHGDSDFSSGILKMFSYSLKFINSVI